MIEAREKVCQRCTNKNICQQLVMILDKSELEYIGANLNDYPNAETLKRFMEISMKPECMEMRLKEHPIEWWVDKVTYPD